MIPAVYFGCLIRHTHANIGLTLCLNNILFFLSIMKKAAVMLTSGSRNPSISYDCLNYAGSREPEPIPEAMEGNNPRWVPTHHRPHSIHTVWQLQFTLISMFLDFEGQPLNPEVTVRHEEIRRTPHI